MRIIQISSESEVGGEGMMFGIVGKRRGKKRRGEERKGKERRGEERRREGWIELGTRESVRMSRR